jgi:hypothetical protein
MLEINHQWTHNGDSGGLAAVQVQGGVRWSALYVQASTIATTMSFQLQTAPQSTGPWVTEGSTSVSATATAGSQDVLRLVGPYQFLRPYFPTKSSGTYTVRLIGV